MNIRDFVDKYDGQMVKSPHGIAGQCVSISSEWAVENGWPEFLGPTAYQIFGNPPAGYEVTANTPANYPSPGDIVFFGQSYGGGDGHTGVVVSANPSNFVLFEQNDPDGSPAHSKTYNYYDVMGWLRWPNGGDMPTLVDQNALIVLYAAYFFRAPDPGAQGYIGQPLRDVMDQLAGSPERQQVIATFQSVSGLNQQVTDLTKQLEQVKQDLAKCQAQSPAPTPQPPTAPVVHPAWLASLLKSLGLYN